MWVAHRPRFGKHALSVLYLVHSVSVKGAQLLLHLQRFLTPPSLNPGVISLEIRLLKTIKRLMSVSTMVAWKALFIPLLFNLRHVKDPESNRDSSAQPTRTPERSTHPYTWRWVDWNARTRQTGEAVQAVPRSPASWLQWLSCSAREPSSRRGRGTCYSSLLLHRNLWAQWAGQCKQQGPWPWFLQLGYHSQLQSPTTATAGSTHKPNNPRCGRGTGDPDSSPTLPLPLPWHQCPQSRWPWVQWKLPPSQCSQLQSQQQ